jgi:hypothetical protein
MLLAASIYVIGKRFSCERTRRRQIVACREFSIATLD